MEGITIIDGTKLPAAYLEVLRPGEELEGRTLPRYFYQVPDWESAVASSLTEHFALYEFMVEDMHEHELLQSFPKYIPCAISLLAAALEAYRVKLGKAIYIAANGGYRSPAHQLNTRASLHSFGTAANIYRIGDVFLDDKESIESYSSEAKKTVRGIWTHPFGHGIGESDDHLHLDIGYTVVVPSDYS